MEQDERRTPVVKEVITEITIRYDHLTGNVSLNPCPVDPLQARGILAAALFTYDAWVTKTQQHGVVGIDVGAKGKLFGGS